MFSFEIIKVLLPPTPPTRFNKVNTTKTLDSMPFRQSRIAPLLFLIFQPLKVINISRRMVGEGITCRGSGSIGGKLDFRKVFALK